MGGAEISRKEVVQGVVDTMRGGEEQEMGAIATCGVGKHLF